MAKRKKKQATDIAATNASQVNDPRLLGDIRHLIEEARQQTVGCQFGVGWHVLEYRAADSRGGATAQIHARSALPEKLAGGSFSTLPNAALGG